MKKKHDNRQRVGYLIQTFCIRKYEHERFMTIMILFWITKDNKEIIKGNGRNMKSRHMSGYRTECV